jgi:hypothetical protein
MATSTYDNESVMIFCDEALRDGNNGDPIEQFVRERCMWLVEHHTLKQYGDEFLGRIVSAKTPDEHEEPEVILKFDSGHELALQSPWTFRHVMKPQS